MAITTLNSANAWILPLAINLARHTNIEPSDAYAMIVDLVGAGGMTYAATFVRACASALDVATSEGLSREVAATLGYYYFLGRAALDGRMDSDPRFEMLGLSGELGMESQDGRADKRDK